jgi:hypothetical protein
MSQVQAQLYAIPSSSLRPLGDGRSADTLDCDSYQRKVSSLTQNYTKDYGQM